MPTSFDLRNARTSTHLGLCLHSSIPGQSNDSSIIHFRISGLGLTWTSHKKGLVDFKKPYFEVSIVAGDGPICSGNTKSQGPAERFILVLSK